jgi:DUF4097 and DUF4098 domain-containing protein YvlB
MKILTSLLLLAAASTNAALSVNESRVVPPHARISFTAVSGDYQIVGGDEPRLTVTGTMGDDVEAIIIDGADDHWHIEVKPAERKLRAMRGMRSALMVITVPRGAGIDARIVTGDLALLDLNGAKVSVQCVGGAIKLSKVTPRSLEAESVSGRIAGDAGGSENNSLKTVSGNIAVSGLSGRISAESTSGAIRIEASAVGEADFATVSGSIQATLVPLDHASIKAASQSGAIRLQLPAATQLELRAQTMSGSIRDDFGGKVQRDRGPGQRLEHRVGSGQVRIEATSASGNIEIRRSE